MKVIAVIKSTSRNAYPLVRHCFLHEGREPQEAPSLTNDGSRVVGVLNGLDSGAVTMHPSTDTRSLCGDVIDRNALRHVILSAEPITEISGRESAFAALMAMAKDWMKRFAPGTPYLGICHDDRQSPHIHLLIRNSDRSTDGGRLSWSPNQLREMQSFDWVSSDTAQIYSIEPGRSRGISKREGTGYPYPRAQHLDARTISRMNQQQIYEHTRTGAFQVGRRDKHGHIKSIIYNGRRIRMATVELLAKDPQLDFSPRESSSARRTRNSRMVRVRARRTPSIG